jgi:hypothetical protein
MYCFTSAREVLGEKQKSADEALVVKINEINSVSF